MAKEHPRESIVNGQCFWTMRYLDVAIGSLNSLNVYDYLDTSKDFSQRFARPLLFFFYTARKGKGYGRVGVETDSVTGWARIMHALGKPTSTLQRWG